MRYKFNKNNMVAWHRSIPHVKQGPLDDLRLYVAGLYRCEYYNSDMKYRTYYVNIWKESVITSKLAVALLKADTSASGWEFMV